MTGSFTTPPWMGCQSITSLPPAFHQASLMMPQYPITLLGGDRHCEVKFFSQEHNTTTQPGLKSRPLDLESSALALTNKSPSLPYHCQYKSLVFLSECFHNLFSNSLIIHDLIRQPESPIQVRWMTLKLNETPA